MTDPAQGYEISTLDEMGEGYGFRKIRRAVGVTAFGINALVLPPDYETAVHYHDVQEETYFVHQGEVEFRFGDGTRHRLGPGGVARVDAHTHRGLRNVGEGDAILVIAGGKDGYVGRDGRPAGDQAAGSSETSGAPAASQGPPGAPPEVPPDVPFQHSPDKPEGPVDASAEGLQDPG